MDCKFGILFIIVIPLLAACSSTNGIIKKSLDQKPTVSKDKGDTLKASATDPEKQGAFHVVGPGETLKHICSVYGLDISKVAKVNRILPPYSMKSGETIFLPAHALVDHDEALTAAAIGKGKNSASSRSGTDHRAKLLAEALRGGKDPAVPDLRFPVPGGVLTSPFGHRWGRLHRGLDIAARLGSPVLACADGKVIFTGSRKRFRRYGTTVLVDHGKGVYTYYAHLSDVLVKKNQKVRRGETIAQVGNTGRSTGPHLHLEVRVANNLFDPLAYFPSHELSSTRVAKRFDTSPMGPVRAKWRIPDLLTASR